MCLDGTLIATTKVAAPGAGTADLWVGQARMPRRERPGPDRQGLTGAGIGIIVPFKGHDLHPDNTSGDAAINALRAPAECASGGVPVSGRKS